VRFAGDAELVGRALPVRIVAAVDGELRGELA